MIVLLILILVLILLYFVGRKSVHSEIIIEAGTDEVWSVLTNVSEIRDWNSVLIPIEGELKEGNTLKYEFRQDDDNVSTIPATVRQIDESRLLNQGGGMPGVLTFDHKYILEEIDAGTKVIIHEEYQGIMVPFWNPSPVEIAYTRLLKELKERVESSSE